MEFRILAPGIAAGFLQSIQERRPARRGNPEAEGRAISPRQDFPVLSYNT